MVKKPQGKGIINRPIAQMLNKKGILTPLRKAIAKQSLRMVGKGGVKVWGRLGSKILPMVGWFSLGYEAVKACNCYTACKDGKFNESEKIWGQ
jgi:hypothetical protein